MGRREVRGPDWSTQAEGKTVFFFHPNFCPTAEPCAIGGRHSPGRTAAVGAVADLTSGVRDASSLVWARNQDSGFAETLGGESHVTGDTVRAVFPRRARDIALEALRRDGLRLISRCR